jgi:CUB domain
LSASLLEYRCGGILTQFPGLVNSPTLGGTPYYPPNASCDWTIMATNQNVVNFYFDFIQIQNTTGCVGDWVKVFDTDGTLLNT